jgi:hypothetical protein
MQDSLHTHDNTEYIRAGEFQLYVGNGSNNIGISLLKIIYRNKIGWFCDLCKQDFLNLILTDEAINKD